MLISCACVSSTGRSGGNGSASIRTLDSRNECFFDGDKKMHAVGTKWHPYLPPFGFDRCSLCTCLPRELRVECRRSVTCPPLMCEESEAFRENPMDCCKRCPSVSVRAFASPDQQSDQRTASAKGPNDLLANGGRPAPCVPLTPLTPPFLPQDASSKAGFTQTETTGTRW